jgi:hypothetical protein
MPEKSGIPISTAKNGTFMNDVSCMAEEVVHSLSNNITLGSQRKV